MLKQLMIVSFFTAAFLLVGCSSNTPTTNSKTLTPEDSGVDKSASGKKDKGGRFPTPPPK